MTAHARKHPIPPAAIAASLAFTGPLGSYQKMDDAAPAQNISACRMYQPITPILPRGTP